MTVFLRDLWGPFHPDLGRDTKGHYIDFYFFGIREDHRMGRWALRYRAPTRTFQTVSVGFDAKKPLDEHKDAFTMGRPMLHGENITAILRKSLPPEALAKGVALSITKGGI